MSKVTLLSDRLQYDARRVAREWLQRGLQVVPVEPQSKKPAGGMNWNRQPRMTEERVGVAFQPDHNVGALLGAAGGHIVDVDLDTEEAVAVAPFFLPDT